ncbi:hypothetical protein HMPREF1990_00204 [Porphyromonas gingivalis W4087]|uniref:Uncharacterized protein n=1 Tax=Porphyromonas gingivalis F0570 TaxID=1227271 RepID=A0A0E2M8G5_PORGN|nr:hypothetical protein HMPREF1555_00091 [Porphyromonas gingivalis F0570]ERJ91153.1 hypothetical protein HMPREF1990_00204 [Porphyromonas gingivalis W4087]
MELLHSLRTRLHCQCRFSIKKGGEGEESGTYEAKKYGTPITISADFSKN